MVQTQKKNGSYHTVMSCFGVSRWDEAIYIPAGLMMEGNGSFRFYDYGEYPVNRDHYMRHLEFVTPGIPDISRLVSSGRALIQLFEISETHQLIESSPLPQIHVGELATASAELVLRVNQ